MNKIFPFILTVIVLGVIIYYGLFWAKYSNALDESNKETVISKCDDNIADSFSGIISDIEKYEYSNYMKGKFFTLNIHTQDTSRKFVNYQFNLPEYKDVLEFVVQGQTIEKAKGEDKFVLKNKYGEIKTFTVPDCRLKED